MLKTFLNVFRIPELRNKLLFTLAMLCVYRIGFYIPLPGVNAERLQQVSKASANGSPLAVISNYLQVFSAGSLSQSTIFGLGIMPYISASIILQLLGTVIPSLEKLKKEGEPGMRKINEWTRYLTVVICLVQGGWWIRTLTVYNGDNSLLYPIMYEQHYHVFWIMGLAVLTAGSLFLMWLGEQIDQYGIGNGVSLIITAGIVSRMPSAAIEVIKGSPFAKLPANWTKYGPSYALQQAFSIQGDEKYSFLVILMLMFIFVFVIAGSILLTQAQRRIKIQTAKHMRGRRVYGGQSQYLPLRVNHAGVMPIIFASSLMVVPTWIFSWLMSKYPSNPVAFFLHSNFHFGAYLYELVYISMIFFFSYFWNTVQFQPKEMANQLRDYGSFIPGLRPGKRTADYLENVMTRITYVGAAFLCVIAVVPTLVHNIPGTVIGGKTLDQNDFIVTQFLGGTGLLIVISVMLDLVNRIEANLVMRNYGGFLESASTGSKLRDKIRGPGRPRGDQPNAGTRGLPA